MTDGAPRRDPIRGSLHSADGVGVVRMEARYDAGLEDVWSAIADPGRLAEWHAQVDGDLRPGGEFRLYVAADDWEGAGHIDACERLRHLRVTTRESDESWRKGQGMPPFDSTIDVTLEPDGGGTVLVVEVRGVPLDPIAFYGAGWQVHAENLAAYLEGREAVAESRFDELVPAYQEMAAAI
jgi:uncharacterized protein YndB with AHSA1/START domain